MSLFVPEDDNLEVYRPEESIHDRAPEISIPLKEAAHQEPIVSDPIDVLCSLPLKYQHLILADLLRQDGLLLLGKGLGLEVIVSNLLHALSSPLRENKRGLIILLNATDFENEKIRELLVELSWVEKLNKGMKKSGRKFVRIDANYVVGKRSKIYASGGIISVTSRIFIVDLLSNLLNLNSITGIIVLHAEKVTDTSNESFIIDFYRQTNKWGFVKAISDDAEKFIHGYQPLKTKLKDLKLSNTLIWPRFHIEVANSLKVNSKNNLVVEISVSLTKRMKTIQLAIFSCIEACINELKRHNPEMSTEYWDISNALNKEFVQVIRATLDPVWHRCSWTTKQVIHDISTLKELLGYLLNYDAIKFYETIKTIFDVNKSTKNSSPWLMLDEAISILSLSRERVFLQTSSEPQSFLLEELPKWQQLTEILQDITDDRSRGNMNEGPILIMCNERSTCVQLRKYLSQNTNKATPGRKFMMMGLNHYNQIQKALRQLKEGLKQEKVGESTDLEALTVSKTFTRNRAHATSSKRRRTRGNKAIQAVDRLYNRDAFIEQDSDQLNISNLEEDSDPGADFEVTGSRNLILSHSIEPADQIVIEKFDARTNESLLDELNPSHIILYEPNLSFIRRIEVYEAIRKQRAAQTFFMYYKDSVEEETYLNSIKREKEAFTKLIREKATLASHYSTDEDNQFRVTKSQVFNTRIAGGSAFRTPTDESSIIVDVREFRSSLPNLCYRIGLKVVPAMLTIGDYIISPRICVERKSIPDLIGSFNSGRLYQQCEQMFRHYQLPALLIEFQEGKSFSLEPFAELRTRPNQTSQQMTPSTIKFFQQDIQAKLITLLIAYPKLKIFWSSSPTQSAQILISLKASEREPDLEKAIQAGVDANMMNSSGAPEFNDAAIDLLTQIPGVTKVNYHLIITKVKNLKKFVNLSLQEMQDIIGKEAGSVAYNFVNWKFNSTSSNSNGLNV
ncbi:hypothetical protein LJB42_004273 [Komagataella kurtzmanii]|nr:hypothetical protein LJB42_004273 [Komagataella kurtzmanii]